MSKSFLLSLCLALVVSSPLAFAAKGDSPEATAAAERIQAEAGTHRLILLGEMHGTQEAPELASALVERYAAAKEPVVLALELDAALSPIFEDYLRSDGGKQALAELLAWPYWHVEAQHSDGRRNYGTIALLEVLRQMRTLGADVDVIGIDRPLTGPAGRPERNPDMATRVREAFADLPQGRLIVLTGNAHAMKERPSYAPPQLPQPMGSFLADLDPFAVDISAHGGSFWACVPDMQHCGPAQQPDVFPSTQRLPEGDVFDLRVVLPAFTLAPLIPAGAASPEAQTDEFFRLLASEPDQEAWLEGDGGKWVAMLSAESRIAIAQRAMQATDPMIRLMAPMQYYAMGMDDRGDAAAAELALDGVDLTGFGWAWLHSGDAGLLQRRLDGILSHVRPRYATLTREQRKRADTLFCDEGKPCHPELKK